MSCYDEEFDDEIRYNINDLYRYNELFNLNLNAEKLQDFNEKGSYNLTKFEDKVCNYDDNWKEYADLNLFSEEAYYQMIDWFEAQIPNFKDESTRKAVHEIVKEIYEALSQLCWQCFEENGSIKDYGFDENAKIDENEIDVNMLERFGMQRDDLIKGAVFNGLYSVGKNLYSFYNFYKTSTFDDVYSKIESLKSPHEGYGYVGEDDKEFYNGRGYGEDGDKLLILLGLIACSKFEKNLEISDAFEDEMENSYEENQKLDFYNLLPIIRKCKTISDERKKNTSVKQKALRNPKVK